MYYYAMYYEGGRSNAALIRVITVISPTVTERPELLFAFFDRFFAVLRKRTKINQFLRRSGTRVQPVSPINVYNTTNNNNISVWKERVPFIRAKLETRSFTNIGTGKRNEKRKFLFLIL